MVEIQDIYSFIAKVHKLKLKLASEQGSQAQKALADQYLNEVLFLLQELKL
jgi:hypothetical protein